MTASKPQLPAALKAVAKSAPSMVPEATIPPPEKEEPVAPQLDTIVKDKKDYLALKRLIEEDLPWKAQEAEAKRARKGIETKIKNLLGKHKVGAALMDNIHVSYYATERKTLRSDLLMQAGVTVQTLLECTTSKPSYTLKISVGQDEDESDE